MIKKLRLPSVIVCLCGELLELEISWKGNIVFVEFLSSSIVQCYEK